MLVSRKESVFFTTAAARYALGSGAAFFEERAAEADHRGYEVLPGFETFAQAPGDFLQSLNYPKALP